MIRLFKQTDSLLLALGHLAGEGASGVASTRAIAECLNTLLELHGSVTELFVVSR